MKHILQALAVGIVNLRELEPSTGHSPGRHSLIVQDSVDGLSTEMQSYLAYVDNTPAIHIFVLSAGSFGGLAFLFSGRQEEGDELRLNGLEQREFCFS